MGRAWRAEAAWALGAMAISSAVAFWVLELWDADLRVLFVTPDGDAGLVVSIVQGILDDAWLNNPALGAPAGQELYDYPAVTTNLLPLAAMRVMGLFTADGALVVNAYFLAAFPLTALSGYALLRWMRVGAPAAMVCAALFALAPYHFLRSEWHLFLGAYVTVPLSAYLVLAVHLDRPLLGGRRTLLTLAAAVVVGLSDYYYAAFTVLLVLAAGLLSALARREMRALTAPAIVAAAVALTVVATAVPTLAHRAEHGVNEAVAQRKPEESFKFSTNLTDLFLPVYDHRLGPLDRLDEGFVENVPVGHERSDRLGLVAGFGFLWLLVIGLVLIAGARAGPDSRHRALSAAAITALLIGTTGGVSGLIAYLVSPQIRSWNRLSIFIALFALVAVGLLLDGLRGRLRRRAAFAAVLGAVLVLGVLDQTTPSMAPDHDEAAAQWHSDGAFVAEIERRLPSGAMVLQLPYVPFPDSDPVEGMGPYRHMRGYIHSQELRWSFGAMRGRPDDWLAPLAGEPAASLVANARLAGFGGIWVDRLGYRDDGAAIEAELGRVLRSPPQHSHDRRLLFFALG